MIVAIYARYSTDLQNPRSIVDQLALCRGYAERQGWRVVEDYTDAAVSAATVHGRFGLERLLADARRRRFQVILAEDLDRLSRNQADIAGLYERLEFAQIQLWTVADGRINELHIGLKGTMSALFIRTLALKVRRGQAGRARAGKVPGGLPYGYRVTAVGERAIDPGQAAVVLRVYRETVLGGSPREIAAGLNADGIPSPRGGLWRGSTIIGSRARSTGILRNPMYAGRLEWGRQQFVKNPDTGRRVTRINPVAELIHAEVADLRIVPAPLWEEVRRIVAAKSTMPAAHARRPKHLLSGLLVCGCCGGPFIVQGGGRKGGVRFGCSRRREAGVCPNRRMVVAASLQDRILAVIEESLLDERLVEQVAADYLAESRRLDADLRSDQAERDRRMADLKRQARRLVTMIAEGLGGREMALQVLEIEREQERLAEATTAAKAPPAVLHPAIAQRYRALVRELRRRIVGDPEPSESVTAEVRGLIERITIHPRDDPRGIQLVGQLAGLLTDEAGIRRGMESLVARGGFEPPTKGL